MIESKDLEIGKKFKWAEEVVEVLWFSELLIVYKNSEGEEDSSDLRHALMNWYVIPVSSHGDEDIMEEFDSACLYRASYVRDSEILFITFKSSPKRVYMYHTVGEDVWERLKDARSKGGYFARYIQGHYTRQIIYPFTQFGDDDDGYGEHVEVES